MRPEAWRRLTELACVQYGLLTVWQIRAAGVGHAAVQRAIAAGLLVPVRRGVLAVAGTPDSVWRPLMAAYLGAGSDRVVASHRAAAALHRSPGVLPGAVELMTWPGPPLRMSGAMCHSTTELVADDVVEVDGFRATCAARTIVDLAGAGLHRSLLERIVADACRRRLCCERDIEQRLLGPGSRQRRGARMLRSILVDCMGGDSLLEDRWLRLLASAGLRPPALQQQVVVGRRVLVLDFAWPASRVGMEVDGWAVHGDRHVWDHDHDKANAYAEAGWAVLFVTSRTAAEDVIRQLRQLTSRKRLGGWSTFAKWTG